MNRFLHLFLFAFLAQAAWSRVKLEIPDPGRMGRSRLEELVDAPSGLARQPRDSQELWMEFADSAVVLAARSDGYLDARCATRISELDSSANRATVKVDYREGPEYRYGAIEFVSPDGSRPQPPPKLPVSPGDGYRPSRTSQLLQEAQRHYRQRGWLDASVEPELEIVPESTLVRTRLVVTLGRIAIFERIEFGFKGRHVTDTGILANLWELQPGDTIRNEDIAKYNRKISQTRLYNMAKLTKNPGSSDSSRTTLSFELAERVPGSFDIGLSWEPTFGWGVDGVIRHKNVRGSMNELSFEGAMAQHRQRARAGVGNPLFLGTPVSLDYGVAVQQQDADLADTTIYRQFDISQTGTFSFLPTEWSNVSLSLSTDRVTKYPLTGGSKVAYEFLTDLGSTLDFRNDPFDPTRGWMLRGDIGWGGQFLNDTSYLWVQSQARAYQPLLWRFYSAFAVEGGQFLNNTTADGAKIFYLGGSRTVRSYTYRGLMVVPQTDSIRNPDTAIHTKVAKVAPLRPRYLRGSAELRMNLPFSFQAVGFVDWARLWNKGQEPDLANLDLAKIGYGAGLRYRLSLLSIRLDYAFGRGGERVIFDLAQAI